MSFKDAYFSHGWGTFSVGDRVMNENGSKGSVHRLHPQGIHVLFDGYGLAHFIEGAIGISIIPKEKTVSEFQVGDLVLIVGDAATQADHGVVYRIGYISSYISLDSRNIDLHKIKSLGTTFYKRASPEDLVLVPKKTEPKFQIGDKVRTVLGTVVSTPTDYRVIVKYADDTTAKYHTDYVELVERPKPEPKIGSVWLFMNMTKYIYVGNNRYFPFGGTASTRSFDLSEFAPSKFVEVTE